MNNFKKFTLFAVLLVTSHVQVVLAEEDSEFAWDVAKCGAAAVVGGAAMTVLGPAAAAGVGFTKAGIAAGSLAAKLMGLSATAGYGGGIIAGLQSLGAGGAGLASMATGAVTSCGAVLSGGRMNRKKACTGKELNCREKD
ncbi:ISG12a protein [Elysia marginata]|uniref:ISG12a protein n=1 Tax=Elysia marginata TaxID=1093978 RepID=A0AAV4I917_9GAST|nr:ISG12a protein [Elysia marginata]